MAVSCELWVVVELLSWYWYGIGSWAELVWAVMWWEWEWGEVRWDEMMNCRPERESAGYCTYRGDCDYDDVAWWRLGLSENAFSGEWVRRMAWVITCVFLWLKRMPLSEFIILIILVIREIWQSWYHVTHVMMLALNTAQRCIILSELLRCCDGNRVGSQYVRVYNMKLPQGMMLYMIV
jgi:hypothetical protein